MTVRPEFDKMVAEIVDKHWRILNRLESNLDCVRCHGPLTDEGFCHACDKAAA
jgi:hypothetical protein